ncbi:hypothetical protein ABPG74_009072 [Tetrahymena malaccensis]
MFTQAFSFNLQNPVQEQLATIVRLDGVTPTLACVSVGGKVFLYTPQGVSDDNKDQQVQFLNLNKNIKSIVSSRFHGENEKEELLLGSQNTLIAYDVVQNSERFYKDIEDGINVVAFTSEMSGNEKSLAVVGGNCSILGFMEDGEEGYWNVASDVVTSIGFSDVDGDGKLELIVGSADNQIRVFKGEEILFEFQEAAKPIIISRMNKTRFAFGLENGMVGIYAKKTRKWRAKSSLKPIAVQLSDFGNLKEGYRPLVVGRANGQIEIRHDGTGETLHKLQLGGPISKIIRDDLRQDGTKQIICILADGQVKGYVITPRQDIQSEHATVEQKTDLHIELEELTKKKEMLVQKVNSLKESLKEKQQNSDSTLLPQGTQLANIFKINPKTKQVELVVQCTKGLYIKNAILFCDKLFDGRESFFYCPQKIKNTINIPLNVKKNVSENISVKCMVGTSIQSNSFQVFSLGCVLPRFSRYLYLESFEKHNLDEPQSFITMQINERIPRFVKWMQQSFIFDDKVAEALEQNQSEMTARFVNIYTNETIEINVNQVRATVQIKCDDIEVAGDLIQDMCQYNNITELESQGQFPKEMEKFKEVLHKVEQYSSARMNITADIADSVQMVKTFIVKAEDARILGDMKFMKKYYTDVMVQNKNLMTELLKRKTNNDILMSSLKEVNSMISKASNLRLGQFKAKVTTLCRTAVKNKDLFSLVRIIENGSEH